MTRILFDVNVIVDVLRNRSPHVEASASAFAAVERGLAEGFLAAHAITTIHYLIRKEMTSAKAKSVISAILKVLAVAAVDATAIEEALQLPCPDFEDAVTVAAARMAGCEFILTRDPKGFRGSPVRPLTPEGILPILERS